ncbi:hypothetical protein GGX14DRAFT_393066 [Mycena pura]|uniref:Uncharacterized protein n=1 Tax=Mycena pura TaxID=153505 RepID=A0AAD6VLR2_9AGAR|nr:hypothetical protein GGX14DRAFT_393066 [Mycena pura]
MCAVASVENDEAREEPAPAAAADASQQRFRDGKRRESQDGCAEVVSSFAILQGHEVADGPCARSPGAPTVEAHVAIQSYIRSDADPRNLRPPSRKVNELVQMSDIANFTATHPPALKVGGRRHSVSARHRPHLTPEPAVVAPQAPPAEQPTEDYPRPQAAPPAAGEEPLQPPPHGNEEEPQRKDRKQESERKAMELAQRKAEMSHPTRDFKNHAKGFGAAGRIAQPQKEMRV